MKILAQIWLGFITLLAFIFAMGCQAQTSDSKRYAELRTDSSGRTQVLICADVWRGLYTVHGFGGYDHNIYYWTAPEGEGSRYRDPVLLVNGLSSEQFTHRGTITVDRERKQVVIDLKRVVLKPGEPEQLEPSPASGTYPIKSTNQEPFLQWERKK